MENALPEKKFLERNSPLTDLFKITHIRTVYNLFMMTFILFCLHTAVNDIMESGTLLLGTVTIRKSFVNLPTCLYIWSLMQMSTLSVYVGFYFWCYSRLQCSPKSFIARKLWDYSWLTIFIMYQVMFVIFPHKANEGNLGISCNIFIFLEQLRLLMKTHAFVRSMAPRFLSYKPHSDIPPPSAPLFSQYLYFLFAPTLIYRDEYPRTKEIRWKFVIQNFAVVGLSIFYIAFILECFVMPVFYNFGTQPLEPMWYVKNIIDACIPGIFLIIISINYVFLHAWLNAWAEMLQFADRLFYKDWWNSTSMRMFHRTWNVVVHDWLYIYIYKDMYEIVVPHNNPLATFTVFFVSSICHDYVLTFAFRFFYPLMLIVFGGSGFIFFSNSNFIMWMTLCICNSILVSQYAIEYYARYNCSPYSDYYADLLLPRSWNCQRQLGL